MVVEGVITRLVRGGALVDIFLESGEPAFVPLSEIPAKAMSRVRQLVESAALQPVRLTQLDRASGTAAASLQGMLEGFSGGDAPPGDGAASSGRQASPGAIAPHGPSTSGRARSGLAPIPAPPPASLAAPAPPPGPRKLTASERARKQQEEILRRLRGG